MVKSILLKSIVIKIYSTQSHATVPHCTEGKNLNQTFCTLVQPRYFPVQTLEDSQFGMANILCISHLHCCHSTQFPTLSFILLKSHLSKSNITSTFSIELFHYYLFPKRLISPLLPRALLWHP